MTTAPMQNLTRAQDAPGAAPLSATAPMPDIALAVRLFDELRVRTGGGRPERGITRASYGLGEQIAHEMVQREARRLGMSCEIDAGCNLYMTLKGQQEGPAVMVGSHLDSVPSGGNFDGAAGVLAGLAVASGFVKAGLRPARDLVVVAIRAEESTWFGASYIGSRAAFGALRGEELDSVRRAGDGIPLGAAIASAGGDTDRLRAGQGYLDPTMIAAFVEPHIEQGRVLAEEGRALGLVTGIRGSFRHRQAWCEGSYSHSGATPRSHRQDAVLATARLVVALDEAWKRLAAAGRDLAVTFGQIGTDRDQAAFSKVAGRVDFSVDIRSEEPDTLDLMRGELARAVAEVEAECDVHFHLGPETSSQPARMDRGLIAQFARIAAEQEIDARPMACGAGHDAAVFAQHGVATAMLFIRNRNGSHNPFEAMEIEDFAEAARLLSVFCAEGPETNR
ncbi:hydantoinase/carbamoylase family amidase [Pseudodonghicola sp.]|uniref:hydantoinase/carbamoylase family amidase n=1 Tax=Pseudodonghicola sp. TaxID=1969463 RepID=UPI003A973579